MFNIKNNLTIEQNYNLGLLPQRNLPGSFYQESSCRADLTNFKISSENRRILRKTEQFTFTKILLKNFSYTPEIQKQISCWVKELGWDFPTSSIKTVFTKHLFNYLYIWQFEQHEVAYSVCYISKSISHIAYVFYNPKFSHSDLPIRLVLQTIIDSQQLGLKYCYLGRYSPYKHNMPGFQNFENNNWQNS